MKICFSINYKAEWGQSLCVCGSIPKLGDNDENHALFMSCNGDSQWTLEIDIDNCANLNYYYLVKQNGHTIRREQGKRSKQTFINNYTYIINDVWLDRPMSSYLYTSGFTDCFFKRDIDDITFQPNIILLKVRCPYVRQGQSLRLCGESEYLGNWNPDNSLSLSYLGNGEWFISLYANQIHYNIQYKLLIVDEKTNSIIHWEERDNRILKPVAIENNVSIETLIYNHREVNWQAAGVAIPVFSLRTKDSYGIGEFSDLRKMVDWAAYTGQKIIQILPVNDTTASHDWTDSYPYSAISIYALHPIYLGIQDYPLSDIDAMARYRDWGNRLNHNDTVEYEEVLKLKETYIADLYTDCGTQILQSSDYENFYHKNEEWLFPYACFCYLRDKYNTSDYLQWTTYSKYDRDLLGRLYDDDKAVAENIRQTFFIQFLLDRQLREVKKYAHQHGVILKGDIPIGIDRNSVDAWTEPHLFNLDMQAGAPPDDFSVDGQNWGFPTYNWGEMEKDGYKWWTKRFRKMSDYFDAYRIDHILGFFRIWEIPKNSVHGLLGYFNPALPYSEEELQSFGLQFDNNRMTKPYITKKHIEELFGTYCQEVIESYLYNTDNGTYLLNSSNDNQRKIAGLFKGCTDEKSLVIYNGLFSLCNEVLFVRDKYHSHLLHPRISAQHTRSYKDLDEQNKAAFDRLYEEFFYHRHNQFWYENAMRKLPALISATDMLVCGEDLGMIPACVPVAMRELQILSLEIERMPKEFGRTFADLQHLPYLSVCTSSTHDMSPIRLWWHEDKSLIQRYYNEVLWKPGIAPDDCTSELCKQILRNNLASPSMLVIFPLQDWLSINNRYKCPNYETERINVPAIPNYYWRYRMHLTIEELIEAEDLQCEISDLLKGAQRYFN